MKKISILMLHLRHGGIEKQTITMANELCDKYDVEIISLYNFDNFIAYKLNPKIKVKYLLNYGSNRKELKDSLKSKKIINIIKELFKAFKVLFNKNRVMIKYIKSVDTNVLFSTRIEFARLISKYNKNKNIITISQEHNYINDKKYSTKVRKSFVGINYIVVMTKFSKIVYEKWLLNTNTKVVVIPNILEKIPNKKSSLNNNRIIAVGRLHKIKAFDELIDVFKIINENNKKIRLILCGGGEEEAKLKNKVRQYGLTEVVEFTGMISSEEVEKNMLKSDLFIMTSISESFSMVIIEANSLGIPVISFDIEVGPISLIKEGVNGFLIKERNKQVMANRILEFYENKFNKEELSNNAIKNAEKYLADNLIDNWINLFEGGELV